jgi:hypothetical protein
VSAEKKTINGTEYSFGLIPPTECIKVEVAIARVIGEPLFRAAVDVKKKKGSSKDKQELLTSIATAVGLLTSKMDADELLEIMGIAFKYVSTPKGRLNIDEQFIGKPSELWQVFVEALQVNFSDFFTGSLFNSIRAELPEWKGLS